MPAFCLIMIFPSAAGPMPVDVVASANGNTGLIPAYTVTDVSATYKLNKGLNFKAGLNNFFNEIYFTRRAGGYPGPGALPADGRTFFFSIGAKL